MLHFFCFFVARRFIDHLLCFVAFCGVLWRFPAFVLWHFPERCDKFLLWDQVFGGAQIPPPFLVVKIENGGAAAPFPP